MSALHDRVWSFVKAIQMQELPLDADINQKVADFCLELEGALRAPLPLVTTGPWLTVHRDAAGRDHFQRLYTWLPRAKDAIELVAGSGGTWTHDVFDAKEWRYDSHRLGEGGYWYCKLMEVL